jgi:hypothetical protein
MEPNVMLNPMPIYYSNKKPLSEASQLYSIDCYQRIRMRNLSNLRWEHVCSVVESADFLQPRKGYTDWQATVDGRLLSMSWDWVYLLDCEVISDMSAGLRTNILCVDDRGYDLSVATSEALLSKVIEGLDWHLYVMGLH